MKAKKIADLAILLAIGIIANIVSFNTGTFLGRFSFVYGIAYISGILHGPLAGMCVTMLADLIPALIFPQGAWMPLITLGVGCISLIVGICNKYIPLKFHWRLMIGVIAAFLLSTCLITAYGEVPLFYIMGYALAKSIGAATGIESPFVLISLAKMISQPLWIVINSVSVAIVCIRLRKLLNARYGNVIDKNFKTKIIAKPDTVAE